jgi:hypothetical protein
MSTRWIALLVQIDLHPSPFRRTIGRSQYVRLLLSTSRTQRRQLVPSLPSYRGQEGRALPAPSFAAGQDFSHLRQLGEDFDLHACLLSLVRSIAPESCMCHLVPTSSACACRQESGSEHLYMHKLILVHVLAMQQCNYLFSLLAK